MRLDGGASEVDLATESGGHDGISAYDQIVLRDLLDRMEPQLQLLEGTVAILQGLSETADSVEPIALAAVAHLGQGSLDEVTACWRKASGLLKGEREGEPDTAG